MSADEHGTRAGYRTQGCRWDACRAWNRDAMREYVARRNAGEFPTTPCSADGCERIAVAKTLCKMHHRRQRRDAGLTVPSPSDAWSDTRRSNSHARRARMHGAHNGDRALLADILDRDGTRCSACGEPVDLDLAYPLAASKSIDHTLPLSRGGTHTLTNVTLMHLRCNLTKGTRLPEGVSA